MGRLRDMNGSGKLGVHVLDQIKRELDRRNLGGVDGGGPDRAASVPGQ